MHTRNRRRRTNRWQQYGPLPVLVGIVLALALVVLVARAVINALDADDGSDDSQQQVEATDRPPNFEDVTIPSDEVRVLLYEELRAAPAISAVRWVRADEGGFFVVGFNTRVYGSRVEGTLEVYLFPTPDRDGVKLTAGKLGLPGVSPPAELTAAIDEALNVRATAELNQRLADVVGGAFTVEDVVYGVEQIMITVQTN
jgi:hypothetical protein